MTRTALLQLAKQSLELQAALERELEPLRSALATCAPMLREWMQIGTQVAKWRQDLDRVVSAVARMPAQTRETLLTLGQEGWYVPPEMPFTGAIRVARHFREGDTESANLALVTYFEEHLAVHRQELADAFPHRATILNRAFDAHERGWYELSIPVFLSQADGLCQELMQVGLYQKKDGRPAIVFQLEDRYSVLSSFLEPLRHSLPLTATRQQRVDASSQLNRHAVLHGESLDYGTQLNSCRAISVLRYVAWVLDRAGHE